MSFTISADDPRSIRALEIAADADQWLIGPEAADGDAVYGVPSQSEAGRYYTVTRSSCDCPDFRQHGEDETERACKHMLAVRLYRELLRAHLRPPRRRLNRASR